MISCVIPEGCVSTEAEVQEDVSVKGALLLILMDKYGKEPGSSW